MNLANKSELSNRANRHAVVVGASIAGMLAAQVLADTFESVTIIETDKLPEQPEFRKGVPESAQPHVLLTKGYRILEELFPGIGTDLDQAGALTIDWAREFYHFNRGGWSTRSGKGWRILLTLSLWNNTRL